MINFCMHYKNLQGEIFCGLSSKKVEFVSGLVEVTLLVCGILMLAKLGAFQGTSQVNGLLVLSGGGVVLLLDIVRTSLNSCKVNLHKPSIKGCEATGASIAASRNGMGFYIDLVALLPVSDKQHHVYTIRSEAEKDQHKNSLRENEFFFYSKSSKPKLNEVTLIWKQPASSSTYNPNSLAGLKSATVLECEDWLIDPERQFLDRIGNGNLQHFSFALNRSI